MNAVRQIKLSSLEEARSNLEALQQTRAVTEIRQKYYSSRQRVNKREELHLNKLESAFAWQTSSQALEIVAGTLALIPRFDAGVSGAFGTPVVKVAIGGQQLSTAVQLASRAMQLAASIETYRGTKASIEAGYDRRQDDWTFQTESAAKEVEQIDKQIEAARLRIAIAEQEVKNHDLQTANAKEADGFMRNKYTNQQLYTWMAGQLAGVYFQSYQLAYQIARRAERAFQYELGLLDSSFIQFGYWDSLKKGLLAGERLHHDLRRMETAYLDQNKREYEITRHVSVGQLDPLALIHLKQTGECFVSLPEALFDLDYPGHYLRRIKSASVTIPCITGPYTSVNCTLTLLKHSVRHGNTLHNGGEYVRGEEDPRFTDSVGAIQSIVTSNAQNDSGLFETNLHDERYLPFEGAGVISQWRIELPNDFRHFDYETVSDVILHVRYTAREAGGSLKQQAIKELQASLNELIQSLNQKGLARLFNLRHEFSTSWHRFLNPQDVTEDQTLTMAMANDRFPFLFQNKHIVIDSIEMFVRIEKGFEGTHNESTLKLSLEAGDDASSEPLNITKWNGLLRAEKSPAGSPGEWTLTAWLDKGGGVHERLDPDAIRDIVIVCHYAIS